MLLTDKRRLEDENTDLRRQTRQLKSNNDHDTKAAMSTLYQQLDLNYELTCAVGTPLQHIQALSKILKRKDKSLKATKKKPGIPSQKENTVPDVQKILERLKKVEQSRLQV